MYTYTVHCTIRTRAQFVRRYQGKRTSEKNEMVTYKDATQAVRYMWVNKQRKRMDLRAILLIIAFKLDFGILDYKKTQMFLININTKYKNKSLHILHCFCISLTTEEWASKYIWRYSQIVSNFWALNSDFQEKTSLKFI